MSRQASQTFTAAYAAQEAASADAVHTAIARLTSAFSFFGQVFTVAVAENRLSVDASDMFDQDAARQIAIERVRQTNPGYQRR